MSETLEKPAETAPPAGENSPGAPNAAPEKAHAAGENSPPPPAPRGLLDAVADDPPADGRPEWCPEQFWKDGQPQVEALAKSWADLRARLARGAGGAPPDSPDAYSLPRIEGLPEQIMPTPDDPVWSAVRQAAHKAGVTQAQLAAIAEPYLREAARLAQPDPEAQRAHVEAELARLGPQGRQLVREVGEWVNGLAARGLMTRAEVAALRGVSTAEGVRALAKLRGMLGEQPVPLDALDEGDTAEQDARRMMREAIERGDEALGRKAERALREIMARRMG